MSCQSVRKGLSAYLDCRLPEADRSAVLEHLAGCGECALQVEELADMRTALRHMPMASPPQWLQAELRVMASRQCARQRRFSSWGAMLAELVSRMRLVTDNLMRPMALPVTGGLLSALVLFSMLVPPLRSFPGRLSDAPTALYTEATVATASPFGVSDEVVVELRLNEEGHIVDYSVPNRPLNRELISQIGNMILFTSFNPATSFGQPTAGRLTVSFRRSHIVVKG